jgi:hypothetical protein
MARSVRTIQLAAQSVLRLPEREASVRCVNGAVWITQDGDCRDTVLGPGEGCAIRGGGAIVEAISPASVVIETRRRSFLSAAAAFLRVHVRIPLGFGA